MTKREKARRSDVRTFSSQRRRRPRKFRFSGSIFLWFKSNASVGPVCLDYFSLCFPSIIRAMASLADFSNLLPPFFWVKLKAQGTRIMAHRSVFIFTLKSRLTKLKADKEHRRYDCHLVHRFWTQTWSPSSGPRP